MASSEISAPKLFARHIAAYSDAELDRYLAENGRCGVVEVEDPDNLPDDFIQRLRDRTRRASETAESHPVDLDQVAALLQDVSADRERSRRSPSSAITEPPLTEEEEHREDLRRQTGYYKMLVDDGGRPSHPLTRLEDIVENPGECREILSFWQGKYLNEGDWRVFRPQWWRWQDFRSLQRFARGQRGYDYWRSLWDEERKMWSFHSPWESDQGSSEEDWQNEWRLDQKYDNHVRLGTSYMPWQWFIRRKGQTIGQQGFPEYAEALKERLARHGFERPFQLDKDATRQDKMTTWIEYLGYEYWWYNYYAGIARSHQKRHDNAWKKLVDSKVLMPGETEEVICNIDTAFRDASEEDMAKRAMQSAKSAVSSAEITMAKWQQSKLSPQTLRQRLLAARSKLETTQAEYESLKRRSDCITESIQRTRDYQIAKRDAKHHDVLLRWMLQQVPLIEAELNPPNKRGSDRRGRNNLLKRNRNRSELDENSQEQSRSEGVSGPNSDRLAPAVASFQEPPSKRPRRTASLSNNAISNPADPNLASGTLTLERECKPRKMNGQASSDRSRTFKPLRRSARIAERAERLDAAITATTLAQRPTTSLSKLSKKRKEKRGRTEMASRRRTSTPRGTSKKGRTYS